MAKQVVIKVDIDTSESVKGIGELNDEMDLTLKTLGDMRKASSALEEELEKTQVGTKRYKELRKELIKVNTEIKNQELSMEALDNEQVASELKSVAGGFVDMAGGMMLVAAGNKDLEKVVQTMAQVEGATKIVTGAMEAYSSVMKLSSTITTLYTSAINTLGKSKIIMAAKTKIVTAAQWLWNAAVTANPIGLIVVGVAALIAGIVALVMNIKNIIKWFGNWKNAVLALLGPIGLVILAYRKLQETRDENFDKTVDQAAKLATSTKNQIELLERQREEESKLADQRDKAFTSHLKRLEAEGKQTSDLAREQIKARITEAKRESEFHKQKVGMAKTELKVSLEVLKKKDRALYDSIRASETAIEDYERAFFDANTELIAFDKKMNDKRVENWKKANDERLKDEEDLIKRSTEAWEKYDQITLDMQEDSLEKREQILQREFDNRVKNLDPAIQAEQQLILKEEELLQQKIWKTRRDWANKGEKLKKVERKKNNETELRESSVQQEKIELTRFQIWMKYADQTITKWQEKNAKLIKTLQDSFAAANETINGIISLVQEGLNEQAEQATHKREERFSEETEALKAQLANRELNQKQFETKMALLEQKKLTEERAAARKAFQIDKAFRISQAVMGTAQAVISGLSAPFPLGIIMAALNGAMGAAQIGVIASQKFRAAKGGVVPGAPSMTDSVDALLAPGEMVINSQSAQMFPQTLSQINQAGGGISLAPDVAPSGGSAVYQNNQQSQRVYVVETDITDTQKKVGRIEESASYG